MIPDPLKQFFIFHTSFSDGKPDMYQFLIRTLNTDAIHFKKSQHNICADPFVSINKRMIRYQRIPKPGSFFFF